MSMPVVLRPKRPRWFAVTAAIAVVSLAVTAAAGWWRGWSPGDWWGLTFGTMAALLMFLAALYPLRRRLAVGPLRTAQDWLQAHVYGSTLAAIFVLIHMGFRLPGGQFGWWLFALTLWTTISGLTGVVLQKWIPALVTAQLSVEVIYERIPEMVAKIQTEAAAAVTGASDVLQRFYDQQVQPAIAGLTPSWSYLLDVHSGRDRRLATFDHIQSFITAEDKDRLADLKSLVTEKIELDAHYSLQRLLRLWPVVHVPPAILLLAAVVAHIATVWYLLMPRTIQPGTPTRSPRYLIPLSGSRLTLLSIAGAVAALAIGVALYATGMHGLASPGHVASAHSAIDGRCADCHQPATAATAGMNVRCERCHDPLDARRFGSPAHAALAGSSANAAHMAQVDCAVCHVEHRGLSANLVKTDDRRCTSCHTFGSFRSHPELAVVRAKRQPDPGLDFSHEVHLKEVAKLGGDACQACHQLTPDERGYEPISFDAHCAKCHIKDRVLTLNGTDALKSLPTLATLLPAAAPGQTMPATESRDERGRVILTGFSHRDPWVLAAADGISRMMDAPGIGLERARLVAEIERVSAIAQAVPVASLEDPDLETLATTLRADVQALDRQIAAGPSAAAAEAAALQPVATAVDPSAAALAAQLGQAPARAATNAPSDAQQLEERRRELTELLDAVAARASGPLAARAADLRKQATALKADPPSAGAPDAAASAALTDRLKAVDVALEAVENAAGPAAAADVESARDGVRALTGASGSARAVARHDLLVLIDAIAARGDQATRARAADLRVAVASLPDGASDSLAVRRDGKARLLDRVDLEIALRRDSGPAPVDAVAQTERSTAARELQTLRARLATIDARLTTSPQLDSARGRAALRGLLDACVKCHRLNDEETALRPVAPSQSVLTSAVFTHKPHLLQAKCETCHTTIATSQAGVDANVPGIANCQGCHNASQARADCVACHEYHPRSSTQVAMTLWR